MSKADAVCCVCLLLCVCSLIDAMGSKQDTQEQITQVKGDMACSATSMSTRPQTCAAVHQPGPFSAADQV